MITRKWLTTLLLGVALISFAVRRVNNLCNVPLAEDDGSGAWFSADPDGLYHMRRVDRALGEGLPVAVRDPYLAFPSGGEAGAPIPWPPYYTLALYALIKPFAPEAPVERRRFVEHAVATWPALFSALTSALVAAAAALLAGARAGPAAAATAALVAGLSHALAFGSLRYAFVGNGDHHAWVSMLYTALLLAASSSLRREVLEDAPRSVMNGTACGVLVGLALGSWVASLELLLLFELALLAVWVFGPASTSRGLAAFGATLHGAAFMVVLPATVGSPWANLTPNALVNLTWVHPALLAIGFFFFALAPVARALRTVLRRVPWAVPLLPIGLGLIVLRSPLGGSVDEALVWARGGGPFMSFTNESRPLVSQAEGLAPLFKYLGYALPAALIAWAFALRAALRGRTEWVPWVVAFPPLLVQACLHRRFAELVVPSQAVLLGWAVSQLPRALGGLGATGRLVSFRASPLVRVGAVGLAGLAAIAAHPATLATSLARSPGEARPESSELDRVRGERELLRWLRRGTPDPGVPADYGVLAQWDLGHGIVWAGERPAVATNFGSYLGLESYLAPWRFFLERSEVAAEQLLERHRARYVIVTSRFRRNVETMIRVLYPDDVESWLVGSGQRAPLWLEGMGARLLAQMGGPVPEFQSPGVTDVGGLGGLRLVYLSPDRYRDPDRAGALGLSPVGAVFEHVPGARVRVQGSPGDVLRVSLRLRYPDVARERAWRAAVTVGADGQAEVRVPYTTEAASTVPGATGPNGDGVALGPMRWSLGSKRGEVAIPERAVREGGTVDIEAP